MYRLFDLDVVEIGTIGECVKYLYGGGGLVEQLPLWVTGLLVLVLSRVIRAA